MTSLPGFVAKCNSVAATTGRSVRTGVEAGALAGKGVVTAQMAAQGVTAGKRLSGVNAALNVRFTVTGAENAVAILAVTGPAQLVNNATKAHDIGAKKLGYRAKTPAGKRRARNAKRGALALNTPYGVFARVHSPGTPGKHFWEKAQPAVRVTVVEAMRKSYQAQLLREFH